MGDQELFTPEELTLLGEEPIIDSAQAVTEPVVGTSKEDEPLVEPAESVLTPEGEPIPGVTPEPIITPGAENMIPQSRFDEVYGKQKDSERKLELIKTLGPDKFYEMYPGEKPEDYLPSPTIPPSPEDDIMGMVVSGGQYNGMTLEDVFREDPGRASIILNSYYQEQARETKHAEQLKGESEREVYVFAEIRSQELFNKKLDTLSEGEMKQIENDINSAITWIARTRRAQTLDDAWFLMNKETILTKAADKVSKATLESLIKSGYVPPVSVANIGGGGQVSGYDALLNLTSDQLQARIDAMGETEAMRFFREAPKSLRDKYPKVPWD